MDFTDREYKIKWGHNYKKIADQNWTNLNVFMVGECILNDIILITEKIKLGIKNNLSTFSDKSGHSTTFTKVVSQS